MTIEESTLIRPIYTELQGILAQMPSKEKYIELSEDQIQEIIECIKELISITNEDIYDRFSPKANSKGTYNGFQIRMTLSALIMRLYGQYFPTEEQPFSGKPAISVNQYQSQKQELNASFAYVINNKLDQAIETAENKDEKKVFEKIKQAIQTAKDLSDVAKTIAEVATAFGMATKIPEFLQRFL